MTHPPKNLPVGQAKTRKQNGVYFGQPGYKAKFNGAHCTLREIKCDCWTPDVNQMLLAEVPLEHRDSVRRFLAPIFERINRAHYGIRGGNCWETAQTLMLVANDPRVSYVEGVWTRDKSSGFYVEKDERQPAPHAWNLVDGYLVDLTAECDQWRTGGDDSPWLHEPMKVYTLDDIRRYEREISHLDGLSISVTVCAEGWADEFGMDWTDGDDAEAMKPENSYESVVMRAAAQRMNEKRPA